MATAPRPAARGVLDDRRRQPVHHQRRADGREPARLDQRGAVLQADPELQLRSSSSSVRCWCGPRSCCPGWNVSMSHGPLDGTLVVDLTRALAGPHAAMMLGDLGARVIKVETPGQRRRHPRLGTAVRRARRDERARESTYFLSRQPQQGVGHPRPQGRRRPGPCCSRWSRRADVLLENFRPGVLDRLGFGIERAAGAQPAAGRPVDHRLRPRRPRGRPGRLRPDRAGRGAA